MSDWAEFFNFAVDLLCMMPHIREAYKLPIPPTLPPLFALCAIALLFIGVFVRVGEVAAPRQRGILVPIAVLVSLLSFGFIWTEWQAIFLIAYPAMVLAIRFGEGAIIGSNLKGRLRVWHVGTVALAIVCAYLGLRALPPPAISVATGLWALLGITWASWCLSRTLTTTADALFSGSVSRCALFALFFATLLYVGSSSLEQQLYQWLFPVGVLVGLFVPGDMSSGAKTQSTEQDGPSQE